MHYPDKALPPLGRTHPSIDAVPHVYVAPPVEKTHCGGKGTQIRASMATRVVVAHLTRDTNLVGALLPTLRAWGAKKLTFIHGAYGNGRLR